MVRQLFGLAFAAAVLMSVPAPAVGQERIDNARIRAVLHELREARNALKDARDTWPPGEKARAQKAIEDAIQTIRTALAVKDVDTFRGVDRNPDYYTRYKDHPRLRAALDDIRDARAELNGGPKKPVGPDGRRIMDDLDVAAGCIVTLIRADR